MWELGAATVVLSPPSVKPPVCQAFVIQKISGEAGARAGVSSQWSELILAELWLPAAVSPTLEAVSLVAVDSGSLLRVLSARAIGAPPPCRLPSSHLFFFSFLSFSFSF